MEFFFVNVGQHFPTRGKRFFCPDFTLGLPCPICEFVSELYTEGNSDSIELAQKLRVRKQYWMNIIDRANEAAGPQLLTAGRMIFKQIKALAMDPQYGDLLIDPDDGLDLTVTRTGTGRNDTEYVVTSDRETSPLSSDDALIDEWLDMAMDLSPVELTDDPSEDHALTHDEDGTLSSTVNILPYERLKEAFEGIDPTSISAGDDQNGDEEEPEDEVSSVISRRRGRRGRRR